MELNKTQTTLAGARILTLATQSSKLLFTKCVATTQTFTTETAVNLNTVPEGIAANSVRLAGIDANRILVRAEFKNVDLGETPRERFAAVLCGRRENSNDVETPICVSFGEEAFTLPIAGATVSALELLFTITMSPGVDAVSTQTSALEASKAEVDQLDEKIEALRGDLEDETQARLESEEGFVTLAGNQTITSEKTFEGISGKTTTMRGFGMLNESGTSAYTCGLVGIDDTFRITAENTTEGENTAEIKVDASLGQIALSANSEITVDAKITPTTNNTVDVGTFTKRFRNFYGQSIYASSASTFGGAITVSGGILRGGATDYNIGASEKPWGNSYVTSTYTNSLRTTGSGYLSIDLHNTMLPASDTSVSLGDSTRKFSGIWTDNLNGKTAPLNYTNGIEINSNGNVQLNADKISGSALGHGTIRLLVIKPKTSISSGNFNAGSTLTSTDWEFWGATFSGIDDTGALRVYNSNSRVETGITKIRTLNRIMVTSNTDFHFVLAFVSE